MAFFSRADCGLLPPKSITLFEAGQPTTATVHWVGSSGIAVQDDYRALWRSIQQHAFSKGLVDIDYNFGVTWQGDVLEGRGLQRQSGAQHYGNRTSLAICYIEAKPLTDAAKAAIERLANGMLIHPHNYWNKYTNIYQTSCPGPEITAWCNGPHYQQEDDMSAADVEAINAHNNILAAAILAEVAEVKGIAENAAADAKSAKQAVRDAESVSIPAKTWRKLKEQFGWP